MTDRTLPPLPEPFDYCYEWDGPYGTRKFSMAPHNGRRCDRSVPLFSSAQMTAHALTALAPLEAENAAVRAENKALETQLRAEKEAHQRLRWLMDWRPALNVGLIEEYTKWTSLVYRTDLGIVDRSGQDDFDAWRQS